MDYPEPEHEDNLAKYGHGQDALILFLVIPLIYLLIRIFH